MLNTLFLFSIYMCIMSDMASETQVLTEGCESDTETVEKYNLKC